MEEKSEKSDSFVVLPKNEHLSLRIPREVMIDVKMVMIATGQSKTDVIVGLIERGLRRPRGVEEHIENLGGDERALPGWYRIVHERAHWIGRAEALRRLARQQIEIVSLAKGVITQVQEAKQLKSAKNIAERGLVQIAQMENREDAQ